MIYYYHRGLVACECEGVCVHVCVRMYLCACEDVGGCVCTFMRAWVHTDFLLAYLHLTFAHSNVKVMHISTEYLLTCNHFDWHI